MVNPVPPPQTSQSTVSPSHAEDTSSEFTVGESYIDRIKDRFTQDDYKKIEEVLTCFCNPMNRMPAIDEPAFRQSLLAMCEIEDDNLCRNLIETGLLISNGGKISSAVLSPGAYATILEELSNSI